MAETGKVDVNHSFLDLVQHLESVVKCAFFKTVPFRLSDSDFLVPDVLSL